MLKELYTAALGMLPQQTRLEVIANNMANANTIGFKRSAVFERNLIDAKNNFFNVPGDVEQNDSPTGSYLDFSQGAFQQTGNALDLAIENQNGFFVLQDEDGSIVFSRAGNFQFSKEGDIISLDGKKLLGENGPINLGREYRLDSFNAVDSQAFDLKISDQGEIFVNEDIIDSVLIAKIGDYNTLETISNSDFVATLGDAIEYFPQDEVALRQGWLEHSNVDIIREMVEMIELQRLFETGSKVIKTNDETLSNSIQIGRFF